MVVAASDGHGVFRMGGSWRIEVLGMPVVLPTGSGPEEGFVSDFVHHFVLGFR